MINLQNRYQITIWFLSDANVFLMLGTDLKQDNITHEHDGRK